MLNKLKSIRENHQMSCQHVADRVGISKVYYWQIENGQRRLSYDLAIKISAVFNLHPDHIFLPDMYANSKQDEIS